MNNTNFLLVEDNESEAFLVERIVKKKKLVEDYRWFKDGIEAISYLQQEQAEKPSVILLDIGLPKISGLEILKTIKSDQNISDIPVVMFSSSYESKDIELAYEYGANSYLTKPTEFSELKTTITTVLQYWLNLNKTKS